MPCENLPVNNVDVIPPRKRSESGRESCKMAATFGPTKDVNHQGPITDYQA